MREVEQQNQRLSQQLEQMGQKLQSLANRLEESTAKAPARGPAPPADSSSLPVGLASQPTLPNGEAPGLLSDWDLLGDAPPGLSDLDRLFVQERPLNPYQPGQLGRPRGPRSAAIDTPALALPAPLGGVPAAVSARERPLDYTQPGELGRPQPPGADLLEGPAGLERSRVDLTQGISLRSPDGSYRIELHDLTQIDYRDFAPTGKSTSSTSLDDQFVIPRQRFYFAGDVGEAFTFYSSINRGFGTLDLLEAYIDTKITPWFNVRVGRMKTPFNYEFYKIYAGDLVAAERSVYVGNFGGNRQIGLMLWGRFLNERLEYALGVYNGPHRSFTSTNDAKSPYLFVNYRPFLLAGSDLLRYLAFGGSINYYRAGGKTPVEPADLTTMADQTTASNVVNASPTFLVYNTSAIQNGDSLFYSGDIVWFLHSLFLMGQYNGGYETYAGLTKEPKRGIVVPYTGYSATASFFLTGEEPITRKEILPLRELRFSDIWSYPGAVELYARLSDLRASDSVFAFGLANSALYANEAKCVDVGYNWYWNRYLKMTFDWQLAEFNRHVQIDSGRFTDSVNTYMVRLQLYY